jgi:predicted negative regulator of RcsB-dependent stress response
MAEEGTQADTGDETYVQSKNVKYVLTGVIVVLLMIIGLQYRELQTAQDTINVLAKAVPEIQKKQ